jgi:Domain of unknown function (DUF4907)
MKKISIVVGLLLFAMATLAQTQAPVNPRKDKLDFEGYTIRLLPAMGGTYGYDILKGKERIVHQGYNPFTSSPFGLSNKEDVYKLAKWQINQLKAGKSPTSLESPAIQGRDIKLPPALEQQLQLQGSRGPWINQHLSPKIANELQISITH